MKTGLNLVFKIYAIDGKKWVKFVAMQQNSANLIYDLNTMKGTVENYLKKIDSLFKQYSSRPEKSHLVLKVSKKQKTVLSHLKSTQFIRGILLAVIKNKVVHFLLYIYIYFFFP